MKPDELAKRLGIGRTLAYRIARVYGIRIGRKLFVPDWVAQALENGLSPEEVRQEVLASFKRAK
jgi:hypothetical protein